MNTALVCRDDWDDKCFICMENYKNPKLLPCSHNFCEEPCIQGLLNSAIGNTFKCPVCLQEFVVPTTGTSAFIYNRIIPPTRAIQNSVSNNGINICSASSSDETDTTCFICLDNFKNPKILPCTHNICKEPCLRDLLHSANGDTFRCPLCRMEFPVPPNGTKAFPPNTNLHHISSIKPTQNLQSNNRNNTCSAVDSDGSDTKCSICLSNFRNPKILPCTHNICEEPCLQGLLNSAGGNTFRCPLCRREFPVPSTGTIAFAYNRNFQTISPTRTEIPICFPLVQYHHISSRNAQENQRTVPGIDRPVVEIRHPSYLPEPHVYITTSCCRPISFTDYIKKACFIAFIVHYVGASLARIGIIGYLFWVEAVLNFHYVLLAQCIINILTALATFRRKYLVAKILSWIVFTILIFGVVVLIGELECINGVKNCYDFVLASRFFYICDLIMFFCFTVFLKQKTNSCCCYECCRS